MGGVVGGGVLKDQEWKAARSARKHFNGIWERGSNKQQHVPLRGYPYPNNSPEPWYR